jgi:ATP synthase protein I
MWKIVALQWLVGLSLSVGLMWVSTAHALSALCGVVSVALPSSIFAFRLSLGSSSPIAGVGTFLVGEFLKIVATLALLALCAKIYPGLIWWAMLIAVIATIKSYFLTFLLK